MLHIAHGTNLLLDDEKEREIVKKKKRILTHSFSEEKITKIVQKNKKETCVFAAMINRYDCSLTR